MQSPFVEQMAVVQVQQPVTHVWPPWIIWQVSSTVHEVVQGGGSATQHPSVHVPKPDSVQSSPVMQLPWSQLDAQQPAVQIP
jgi:hypothetical protein